MEGGYCVWSLITESHTLTCCLPPKLLCQVDVPLLCSIPDDHIVIVIATYLLGCFPSIVIMFVRNVNMLMPLNDAQTAVSCK